MNIQWIVLDVDGVLSDGTLIYTSCISYGRAPCKGIAF